MIGKKINQLATELAPVSTDLTIIGDPISGVSKKITLAQLGAIFSGAVSFYTNLAGFPATGDINVIYCAKDTQKLYLWSGSAYVEVFPSQALLDTYQLRSEKGVSNGYASLDSSGKVPISQLPSSIMEYKGTWNAATNTPTLANGTGDTGDVYICNVAGTVDFGAGPITFAVGDYVIYSGSIWQRSSGAVGTVTSVAASITGDAIGITGSPVTTSGTLAFAFAGTGAQYIKGDGTLATFPSTIAQAERLITEVYNSTGATLTKGTIVYINGGQGNLPTVTKALATGDSTSAQTFGVVQADITNNNNGYVVVAGKLSDLDTQAYTEGTQLYLSSTTAGAWTSTKQYAPAHLVYVGIVVRSHPTQGIVEIKIQNGYELDELHNVAAQTPSNNDGLFWESATSLWKNKSISTILGGTPITGSGNVNAIPKFTANSVLGNSVMEDDGNFVSMRGLKLNASAGVGNTINFQQGTGITAGGLGYSTIGASSTTGFIFYIDQNTTSRNFILDTSTITSDAQRTYSMPDTSGTLALVSQLTGGTVTSVGLSSATSGVTIGSTPITTSGTITLAIATASGSQQGLLSSTDWTTFNNKQDALTNPVTGTGTTNYLPKFTGTSTIGNSGIYQSGNYIGIGTTAPIISLQVRDSGNTYSGHFSGNDQTNGVAIGTLSSNVAIIQGYTRTFSAINDIVIQPSGGNLGLGVTPSAWGSNSFAFQTQGGAVWSFSSAYMDIWQNSYYNGASSIYQTTAAASFYRQTSGSHEWNTAPSGTAGTAISWTQAMTLDASGNLGVGATSVNSRLQVTAAAGLSHARWTESATTIGFVGGAQGIITGHNGKFAVRGESGLVLSGQGNSADMIISSTGAATFSSSVTAGGVISTTVGDTNQAMRLNAATGFLQFTPYYDSTYGAFINSLNAAASAYLPITIQGSKILMLQGNVGIGTTSPVFAGGGGLHINQSGTDTRLHLTNSTTGALSTDGFELALVGNDVYYDSKESAGTHIFYTAGSERMRITSGGNVQVGGTTSSNSRLYIKSPTSDSTTNALLIHNSSTTDLFYIRSDAAIYAPGVYNFTTGSAANVVVFSDGSMQRSTSSLKYKNNVRDYDKGLDIINQMRPVYYNGKNDGNTLFAGLIAEEVHALGLTEFVQYAKDGSPDALSYQNMVALLIKGMKELKAELDTLKNK